ncbi:hypothetical protein R5R35_001645 [Gryllus longicercus]|uniref:LRRNT domain-containing protein n=1 Tax=Gryllus longicercus TaxID=2509291 RepID=A0AAN9VMV8_9ORTH
MDPWRGALLLLLAAAPARAGCPSECECRASGLHPAVDCSALQFTALPPGLPADTSHLRLGFNNIRILRNGSLTTAPNVARLWLNDNGMEIIEPGAFNYLSSLSWLDLENNKITSLHPDTFVNLTHLFKMILSGNPLVVPENSVFLRSEYLQILDMANCGLEEIPSKAFTELRSLMTLRLGNNSLRAVTINVSSLSHLDLHKNSIGPTTNRLQISAPRLLKLDLSSCLFATISPDFLGSFPLMEYFDISDNIIDFLNPDVFNALSNLLKLNLTNNLIYTLPANIIDQNRKLEAIDLSNNPLVIGRTSILTTCSARIIMMKRCRFRDITSTSLNGLSNATELHLSDNKLQTISKSVFTSVPLLVSLYLDGNKISQIEVDAFEDLTQLTFLDLSRNSLQLPEDGPFLRSSSLGALRLDACGLEALPAAALRALPALRSLSLAGNDLAFVSDAALRAAPALRALHVARNRWRCDCALRQLWFWCAGADEAASGPGQGPEREVAAGAGAGARRAARCPDAEETACDLPRRRRFTALAHLTCRDNSEEELDDDVEWVGAAAGIGGGTRAPPDRLSA